jgi:hypothetical protein
MLGATTGRNTASNLRARKEVAGTVVELLNAQRCTGHQDGDLDLFGLGGFVRV